jgi:thiosulfate reductase cytochrome b subunit
MQALLVLLLALTGMEVHYPHTVSVFGFEQSVWLHRIFAWSFVVLIAFAIFWHFTTGAWKQYRPTGKNLLAMVAYYAWGIFRGQPKPVHKTRREKLNPLQRLVYLGLELLVIPVLVTTGFLYLYHPELRAAGAEFVPVDVVAQVHTFAAWLMLAFLFGHVYLTTTGETPTANLQAMVTGWEDLDESAEAEVATDASPGHPTGNAKQRGAGS